MAIRILIADNHSLIREGLRRFLGRDHELRVVGEAADGIETIEKARALRPDIVLLDLLIPLLGGIDVIATIRSELGETRVLVLTSALDNTFIAGAMRAGAIGYLLKDTEAPELRKAIKAACAGQIQLAPQVSASLLRELHVLEHVDPLTEREMDVLRLLAQGHSNKEIVSCLNISVDTVKTHVRHVLAKLGVRSRTQATLAAMRLGLVPQDTVSRP